jgi:cobalt/nickel transport system ATP-binding protein
VIILETRGLKYTYPDGTVACQDLNIEIKKGKKVAFVGQNGSGKSTLFLLLNGTLKPDEYEVRFHGSQLKYDSKSLREIRKSIGIVFQNSDDQIFAPTVYQDIAFGPANLGYSKERVDVCVQHSLRKLGSPTCRTSPPIISAEARKKGLHLLGLWQWNPK